MRRSLDRYSLELLAQFFPNSAQRPVRFILVFRPRPPTQGDLCRLTRMKHDAKFVPHARADKDAARE